MNDLIAVQKIVGWEKLKTLVRDSISSHSQGTGIGNLHVARIRAYRHLVSQTLTDRLRRLAGAV